MGLLGQPSTTQAVPHGYASTDQVQCWYNQVFESSAADDDHRVVTAELTYSDAGPYADKGMLRAGRVGVGDWEVFTVCYDYTDASYSIFSPAAGAWVSAEIRYPTGPENREGMLRARAGSVGPWEKFKIENRGGIVVSIRSLANRLFVSAELAYSDAGPSHKGMLRARAGSIGPWEEFYLQSAG